MVKQGWTWLNIPKKHLLESFSIANRHRRLIQALHPALTWLPPHLPSPPMLLSATFKYLLPSDCRILQDIARYCSDECFEQFSYPKGSDPNRIHSGHIIPLSSRRDVLNRDVPLWGGNATVVLAHQQEVIRWPQEGQPQNLRMVRWSLEDRRWSKFFPKKNI